MLEGRVAVVTGAGRGLGRAYALAMAEAGASVVVNDLDAELAEAVVDEVVGRGGAAAAVPGDVGAAEVADRLIETAVERYGRLDVMCTNAGALRDRTLDKLTDEDFDLVVASHLRGTFLCGRAAVRRFRAQGDGGRLLLIGSPAGQHASFGQTAYSASKAAIVGLVRTWAEELARFEVTVNGVVPTALTRMVATIPGLEEAVAAAERGDPVPRDLRRRGLGTPDDVAPLLVYLASDAAAHITGQCLGAGGDRLSLWSHPQEVATLYRDGGWTPAAVADGFDEILGSRLQPYQSPRRRS